MAQNISNKIVDKRNEDDYAFAKKTRNYKKLFRFYLLPIISISIFLVILMFTIIPNVKYMINGLEEGKQLKKESEELDRRISLLKTLKTREEENQQILNKVNLIIPSEQSEVVKFRQKVAGLATNEGLLVESLQAGENIIDEDDAVIENNNNQLIEIPSKFSFSGDFDAFRKLFLTLYEGDDFFIITNMDLDISSVGQSSGTWKGQFDLTKYQFSERQSEEDYMNISERQPVNQSVINFIEQNFGL